MRAVPRLVERCELTDEGSHLGVVERHADHDCGPARAHREHRAQLGQSDVGCRCFGEEGDKLMDVGGAEDGVL